MLLGIAGLDTFLPSSQGKRLREQAHNNRSQKILQDLGPPQHSSSRLLSDLQT